MILALDQSLTNTGYCLYDNGKYTYGAITPKKLEGMQRLEFIVNSLCDLLDPHPRAYIIIEGYAFGISTGSRCFDLGELGGILKWVCHKRDIPVIVIPPTSHKKYTTGKGNSKKEQMLKEVYKHYGVDLDNDNIADAVSMMMTYQGLLQHCGLGEFGIKLNAAQVEVCDKLKYLVTETLTTVLPKSI